MVTLYYLPGAVCAQKALIAMLAKGAPVKPRAVTREDLASEGYRAINPKGVVPSLVLEDGMVIVESTTIMRFLDEAFDGPALQLRAPAQRAVMNNWLKLMDEELFPAIGYLTMATLMRESMLTIPRDALLERLTQTAGAAVGAMRADAVWNGVGSRAVSTAILTWRHATRAMAAQLRQTRWLAGDAVSLADFALAPAFFRVTDLGLGDWWLDDAPEVADWWARFLATSTMAEFTRRFPNPLTPSLHAAAGDLRATIAERSTA